jgi:hypothetical protein
MPNVEEKGIKKRNNNNNSNISKVIEDIKQNITAPYRPVMSINNNNNRETNREYNENYDNYYKHIELEAYLKNLRQYL